MSKTLEWNIDVNELAGYKNDGWTEDYFITRSNKDFGILVYNINEWRMLSYAGHFGLYSNQAKPILELNSDKTWICFDNERTFSFLEMSNCIACRILAFDPSSNSGGMPFLILNLKDKKFGFIEFDNTSIYYGLEEIEDEKIKIIEVHPKDLKRIASADKRTNEIVDLATLPWFDWSDFDTALEKYVEGKSQQATKSKDLPAKAKENENVLRKLWSRYILGNES